jgi:hypothetical protein
VEKEITMTEHKRPQPDDQEPRGQQMGDQGPSYGSSYAEHTPGDIEANRRASLDKEEEADTDPAQRPDR